MNWFRRLFGLGKKNQTHSGQKKRNFHNSSDTNSVTDPMNPLYVTSGMISSNDGYNNNSSSHDSNHSSASDFGSGASDFGSSDSSSFDSGSFDSGSSDSGSSGD